jgi:tricorn protease-like protein
MKYVILFSLCFLFSCSSDNQKIEGVISDEEGEPLNEVMVQVMGTDLYSYSNAEGYFAINTKSRGNELLFNLEGYELERYDIQEDEVMQVSLKSIPPEKKKEEQQIME